MIHLKLDHAHIQTIGTQLTFRLHILATAAHRLLDPIRDLVYGQIFSGCHTLPLRLKTAIFALNAHTDRCFPQSDNTGQRGFVCLTHKRRFGILRLIKTKFLSFKLPALIAAVTSRRFG